jgi:tetratricopeptide (TPR) repeat protein
MSPDARPHHVTATICGVLCAWFLAAAAPAGAQVKPSGPPAGLTAASRALAAGDLDRAGRLLSEHLGKAPRDVKAQVLLIRVRLEQGKLDAAYSAASRAAREHPADVDVLYFLGLVTRRMAADQFQRLTRDWPASARVHQLRAETLEAQERRADAEKEYAAALAADGDLLEALLGLARLQRIRLACDEARAHYERAEALRPTFDGAYGLGVCHGYLQQDAQAIKKFEQAVERDPSAAVAWAGLGTSLVKVGRTAEGITRLQRAIRLAPDMDEAHYMLGMAYQASGDTVRAQAAFAKAEQLRTAR